MPPRLGHKPHRCPIPGLPALVIALSVSATGALAAPAAGIKAAFEACTFGELDNLARPKIIAACNTALASGTLAGEDLVQVLIARAIAYSDQGKFRQAIADLDKAIGLGPRNKASAYFFRGSIHRKSGQFEPAIRDLDAAIKLNAKSHSFYAVRARTYFDAKRHKQALADINQAIGLTQQPRYIDRKLRGRIHRALGEEGQAIADFRSALKLRRTDDEVHLTDRGTLFELLKDRAKAIAAYRAALRIKPGYQRARKALERLGAKP